MPTPYPDPLPERPHDAGAALRREAEKAARVTAAEPPERLTASTPEETRQLLHALRVHQIELEMQNEELRRTQLELDSARARYFDLYDLAPVGYCTVSAQGRMLEANFTAVTLLGVTRGTLVGQPVDRFIARAHRDTYDHCRKRLFASGTPQTCELQMARADGIPLWVRLSFTLVDDSEGAPRARMVLNDITESRALAAAIQTSEARYRMLVEWSPEAIAAHRDGHIIYANAAALKMFGARSLSALVGTPILDRAHPAFHRRIVERLGKLTPQQGATPMIEEVLLRLDGSAFDAEVQSIQTVYDGIPAIQVAIRDVSERKRVDQLLQERNTELERARQVAVQANRAKSDFLSSMSHELRSPLHSILGFAQLMASGTPPPTPTQTNQIEFILQAGWHLLALINEILDLEMVESGNLSLTLEPIALSGILKECQTMIAPQAETSGIAITFQAPDPPCVVQADATRLKQILINLLSNAVKYNRVGGSVEVTCSRPTAQRVRVSVRDTGPGLPPEKYAQLFQPFNRLGQEGGSVEGTGIGLVVSKRLVELMQGCIGAESEVGAGSVFWFELHLATLEPAHGTAGEASAQAPEKSPQGAALRTLLCIDDNPSNLELIGQLIARRPDLHLLTAEDALQGIALARAHQPAVVLMDIQLPGINGFQAMQRLQEDPSTRHIPVLALSANAMPGDIEQGGAAGFFGYVTKPIRIDVFMATLDRALEFAAARPDRPAPVCATAQRTGTSPPTVR